MGATPLQPPSVNFHKVKLDIELVSPAALCRISSHATGEPFFGRSAGCRFDDPRHPAARRFGSCYLGLNLEVAFAESVLHNLEPNDGHFVVEASELARRFALSFEGPPLRLANLTGSSLLLMGANGELTGTSDYSLPQQWAQALVTHPARVDGLLYLSRRVAGSLAVVLFERDGASRPDIHVASIVPLYEHVDFAKTLATFKVDIQ